MKFNPSLPDEIITSPVELKQICVIFSLCPLNSLIYYNLISLVRVLFELEPNKKFSFMPLF